MKTRVSYRKKELFSYKKKTRALEFLSRSSPRSNELRKCGYTPTDI